MLSTRWIKSSFLVAMLGGCTPQLRENAKEIGFAAAVLPGVMAYTAIEPAFSLGPGPRQPRNHPLTGNRLGGWTVAQTPLDVEWSDESHLTLLSEKYVETWKSTGVRERTVQFPLSIVFPQELQPLKGTALLWTATNHQSFWGQLGNFGIDSKSVASAFCLGVNISSDGSSVLCVDNSKITAYSTQAGLKIWDFDRPNTCESKANCHPAFFTAAGNWIAYADSPDPPWNLTTPEAVPISLRSETGETRKIAPVLKGRIVGLRYSPSSNIVIVIVQGLSDLSSYAIDAKTGKLLAEIPYAQQNLLSPIKFRISQNDRFFCGPTWDQGLVLIDLRSGKQEKFKTGAYQFVACDISPDGSQLAVAVGGPSEPGLIAIYSLNQ